MMRRTGHDDAGGQQPAGSGTETARTGSAPPSRRGTPARAARPSKAHAPCEQEDQQQAAPQGRYGAAHDGQHAQETRARAVATAGQITAAAAQRTSRGSSAMSQTHARSAGTVIVARCADLGGHRPPGQRPTAPRSPRASSPPAQSRVLHDHTAGSRPSSVAQLAVTRSGGELTPAITDGHIARQNAQCIAKTTTDRPNNATTNNSQPFQHESHNASLIDSLATARGITDRMSRPRSDVPRDRSCAAPDRWVPRLLRVGHVCQRGRTVWLRFEAGILQRPWP